MFVKCPCVKTGRCSGMNLKCPVICLSADLCARSLKSFQKLYWGVLLAVTYVLHGQKYTLESETQKSKYNDPIVRIDVGVG